MADSPHPLLEHDVLTPAQRQDLLEGYISRGRALVLDGDRGLIDSHRRRSLNLAQFLTPTRVARVLAQAVGLVRHPKAGRLRGSTLPAHGALVDLAGCGNGRLLQFAPHGWTAHGLDLDPLACRAARLSFPDAEILEGNLVDLTKATSHCFTLALVNPPFSVALSHPAPLRLLSAGWGAWGAGTSVQSHLAAVELGMALAPVLGAILPTPALDGHEFDHLFKRDWRERTYELRLRIDLPRDAFASEGTEWPCSIIVATDHGGELLHQRCNTWDQVNDALTEWVDFQVHGFGRFPGPLYEHFHLPDPRPHLASLLRPPPAPTSVLVPAALPQGHHAPTVRLALGGRSHKILLKPNGPYAAHVVEEVRYHLGWLTSDGFSPQSLLDWTCDLTRNAGAAEQSLNTLRSLFQSRDDVALSIDHQVLRYAGRADRRNRLELSDFLQHVRQHDRWTTRGNDPLHDADHPARLLATQRHALYYARSGSIPTGVRVPRWHRATGDHRLAAWPAFPLYPFCQDDIARALTHRALIYSAKQGLGKTRFSVGAVIAAGVSRAVWVLETRLVNEFERELTKLGLHHHFHLIDSAEDLRHLKQFNVITYSTLREPLHRHGRRRGWGPGTTFAAALARRRLMVIVDEAHKLAGATTKQSVAARLLCNRARRVILMTGTAIRNYPRNLFGLAAAGWGDSGLNPYGYRRPQRGSYTIETASGSLRRRNPLIRGITVAVDSFVSTEWVTCEFENTASTGRKAREVPRVKNPALWDSFVRPKILRRLPDEPEVRPHVPIPSAVPQYRGIAPNAIHVQHYKRVLDQFAALWRARIERERAGGRVESGAAHILPELDALRFASTVPMVRHAWADGHPELVYPESSPTTLMQAALEQIAAWVAEGERVLVGAEKPSALQVLQTFLANLPAYVPDTEPISAVLAHDANIKRRNALIDRVRHDPDCKVLLLSVGMGKEGLNLEAVGRLLTLDLGWVPGDLDQYRHRILRPGQLSTPEIVHLYNEGVVDAYMLQLIRAKEAAIGASIDGLRTDFDYSKWKDLRTFTLEMLRDCGYAFAAAALERPSLAA